MKTKYLILILILFLSTPNIYTQDLMDALKQTAEMHNEQHGDDSTEYEPPSQEEWPEIWAEYEEGFKGLSAYEQCFVMMTYCLKGFYKMEERIEEEGNCKMKYDLYGMQLLNITSINTIMYCPEKISELSDPEAKKAYEDFFIPKNEYHNLTSTAYEGEEFWLAHNYLREYKFGDEYEGQYDNSRTNEFIEWMWEHFHPYFTSVKALQIGQKMEALGCGG